MAYIKKRTYKSGKEVYVIGFKDQTGQWRERTAGERRKDAEALLRRVQEEVARGDFGKVKEDPTLSEFYDRWIDAKSRSLKASSLADYKNAFNRYILPVLGKRRIGDLTPSLIQKWLNGLCEQDLSPATVRKAYRYLRSCLGQAVAWGLLEEAVFRGVILPRVEAKEIDCLTPAEVRVLLSACEGMDRALFGTLAYSGLRLGEALGLRTSDIDLEANCIRVRRSWSYYGGFTDPKTAGSRRTVPILPLLREILTEHLRGLPPEALLFPSTPGGNRPMDHANALKRFKRALRRAGLREVTIHSLRHSFASLMLASGCSIKALSHALGHSSPTLTLNTYSHLIEEAMGDSLMRADSLARGLLEGRVIPLERPKGEGS